MSFTISTRSNDDSSGELVLDSIAQNNFPFLAIPTIGDFHDLDDEQMFRPAACSAGPSSSGLGRKPRFVWMAVAARERRCLTTVRGAFWVWQRLSHSNRANGTMEGVAEPRWPALPSQHRRGYC